MRDRLSPSGGGLRIHQMIARDIGVAILSGRHRPGDNFGGEIEEAERLKVSRTAYREAIRILVAKGLLESRPKAGTHVTPRARWNMLDPDVLAWMFASGEPDARFVRDLFELRGLIEPAAAALAARRRTQAQLDQMHAALETMRIKGLGTAEGRLADQQFHSSILQAADNEPLASLVSSVGAAVTWTTRFKLEHSATPRESHGDHLAVLEGIAARDPERARAAMEELLSLALRDMATLSQNKTGTL